MHVDALYVFPLKSAAPIRLAEATLDDRGIRWDRRWMVVDAGGRFVTQREHPRLALARTALGAEGLRLDAPELGRLHLPFEPPAGSERVRVRVWRDECDAVHAGSEASAWVSELLGIRASIVFMPDESVRQVDPKYAPAGRRVGFADAFPLLLLGRASFDDLRSRVDEPLTIERFRPNIVVSGAAPYAEDDWTRLRAGDVEIELVKPCSRCTITTVDPATATRGAEPLRTLATYRRRGNEVLFGWNALHTTPGATLHTGAPVHLIGDGP